MCGIGWNSSRTCIVIASLLISCDPCTPRTGRIPGVSMRIELRELRCLAALVVLVTAPGAGQVARVGVSGRVDYNPYFAIGLTDPRLRTVLQSTDPQVLLGFVEQTVLSVGQGEVAAAAPPAALGVLAAGPPGALRAFWVAGPLPPPLGSR